VELASEEEATAFYDALAPMFDVMTDWEARLSSEGPFLRQVLHESGAVRVLDAACGSGGHALALARWGYDVAGADASPVMIELAQQKAAQAGLDVPFVVSDLAALGSKPGLQASAGLRSPHPGDRPEAPVQESAANAKHALYDAVLCLGNSLPHLLTQEDLVAALRGMAGVLRPGGLLLLQNLNYDLRWVRQPRWFAAQGGEMEGRQVLVWRFADYDLPRGRIEFHIALFRRGESGWRVDVHTTPQRPLFRADLLIGLAEAGFGEAQSYGGMKTPPEPFDIDRSGDLVVVARRAIG
jgi:SAM-dependent methyltransferase